MAVAVTDDEMVAALDAWAREQGIFVAPEGAASLAAYRKVRASGYFTQSDEVVLFNTGLEVMKVSHGRVLEQRCTPTPSRGGQLHAPLCGAPAKLRAHGNPTYACSRLRRRPRAETLSPSRPFPSARRLARRGEPGCQGTFHEWTNRHARGASDATARSR
jgi:hypothetical protein